jgi:hypothetical protein
MELLNLEGIGDKKWHPIKFSSFNPSLKVCWKKFLWIFLSLFLYSLGKFFLTTKSTLFLPRSSLFFFRKKTVWRSHKNFYEFFGGTDVIKIWR